MTDRQLKIDIQTEQGEEQISVDKPVSKEYMFRTYVKVKSLDTLINANPASVSTLKFFFLEQVDTDDETSLLIVDKNEEEFDLINRRIKDGDYTSYVDTISPINREMFVKLRENCKLGFKCLFYTFPVLDYPDRFWEVMVFWGNDGQIHPWVSASCQYTDEPPPLPFEPMFCIIENDPNNSDEVNEFVTKLWSEQYAKIDERDIAKV